MGIRTALRQTRWVTLGVLAALLWIILIGIDVATSFDWFASGTTYIGHSAPGGIIGFAVLAGTAVLLVLLLGELSETDPGPDSWPPE